MKVLNRLRGAPLCILIISFVTIVSTILVLYTAYFLEAGCKVSHEDCSYELLSSVQSHAMMLFPNQLFLAIDEGVAIHIRMVFQVLVSAVFLLALSGMDVRRWYYQLLVIVAYLALSFAATVAALAVVLGG